MYLLLYVVHVHTVIMYVLLYMVHVHTVIMYVLLYMLHVHVDSETCCHPLHVHLCVHVYVLYIQCSLCGLS